MMGLFRGAPKLFSKRFWCRNPVQLRANVSTWPLTRAPYWIRYGTAFYEDQYLCIKGIHTCHCRVKAMYVQHFLCGKAVS